MRTLEFLEASWVKATAEHVLRRAGSPEFDVVLVGESDMRSVLLAYEVARHHMGKVGFYSLEDGLLSVSDLASGDRVVAILDGDLSVEALERVVDRHGAALVAATSLSELHD